MPDDATAESAPAISWADAGTLDAVAIFFATVIAGDTRYISHGELQTGLSVDGVHWVDDLVEKFREDLTGLEPDRSVAVAHQGRFLVGAAIMLWVESERVRYAVLEDMVVHPDHRSSGIGQRLVAFVEQESAQREMQWMFLESGLRNHGAHAFFEARGFAPISKVFVKPVRRCDGAV